MVGLLCLVVVDWVYSLTMICGLYVVRLSFGCFDFFAGVCRLVYRLGFGLLLGFA